MMIIGIIAYFQFSGKQTNEPSVKELVEATWETEEITTNLKNSEYIMVQFQIQLENKQAKNEVEQRDFQFYNIIINELAQMDAEDFNEKNSLHKLENRLKEKMNELLQSEVVQRVYTVKKLIQ